MLGFSISVLVFGGRVWAATTSSCAAPSLTYAGYAAPSVAPGFAARLVANGLQSPRGIVFDKTGRLLVVQQGLGIQALTFDDGGGECVSVKSKDDVVRDVTVSFLLESG